MKGAMTDPLAKNTTKPNKIRIKIKGNKYNFLLVL
jgi:hypothetical protein